MTPLPTCLLAAADAVEAASDQLGALDRVAGDGDHGTTMTIGARTVRGSLADCPDCTGPELLTRVAMAMGSIGGAIGPIYAAGLLAVARSPAGSPVSVADLRAAAEVAETAVVALGNARPGDKTIVDALHPLVEALRRAEDGSEPLESAVRLAAAAAREGAEATAGMTARLGRASRLGERGRDSADPGATSFAVIVEAMADAFLGRLAAEV